MDKQQEAFIEEYMQFLAFVQKNKLFDHNSHVLSLSEHASTKKTQATKTKDAIQMARQLFSYDVPGLKKIVESEPDETFISRQAPFVPDLHFDTEYNMVIKRLMYPLHTPFIPNGDLDAETSQKTIRLYTMLWTLDVWGYNVVIPLHHFYSDLDNTTIGNFSLRNWQSLPGYILSEINENAAFYLFAENKLYGPGMEDNWSDLLKELQDIITALRLVLPEQDYATFATFGLSAIYLIPVLPKQKKYHMYQVDPVMRAAKMHEREKDNAHQFTHAHFGILQYLLAAHDTDLSDITLAIRRFNLAYTRDNPEDRIIDLLIALESSLLHGSEDASKDTLIIRATHLLDGIEPAQKVADALSTAFHLRNAFIHHGQTLKNMFSPQGGTKAKKKPTGRIQDLHQFATKYGTEAEQFTVLFAELTRKVLIELIQHMHRIKDSSQEPHSLLKEVITTLN